MAAKKLVVAVFLLGASWAQRDGADEHPELPTELAGKCIRNGGMDTLNKVERAFKHLRTCYYNLADWDKLLQDIREAQRLGRSANEVFKKYCSMKSEFVGCITELTESFKECFAAGERARGNLDVARNVADQLLEFICQEDGDSIASFIAGGRACLEQPDARKVLAACRGGLLPLLQHTSITHRESSMSHNGRAPMVVVSPIVENMLYIDYDDSTCAILYEFQQCVVQELKTCSQDLEVGNTAQALIRALRVSTPCRYKPNSASAVTVTILSSVMAASSLLLM